MNLEYIYEKIATHYGVTVEEVKRDLLQAMDLSVIKAKDVDDFVLKILFYGKENLGLFSIGFLRILDRNTSIAR